MPIAVLELPYIQGRPRPPYFSERPPTLRKFRGPKGAAFGPPTCADPGGPIRPWKTSMTKKKIKKRSSEILGE